MMASRPFSMRACEGLDYGHSCSVLKASIWVRMTACTLREFPMPGEIGFRIGVIVLGTIPVVLVIAAVFWK